MFSPSFSNIFNEGIWKEKADFADPRLQGLALRLQKSVLSARAPAAVNTYHRAFKRWMDFAVSNLQGNYLPANPTHAAVYLQHLLESTKSCSSVDSAFYAIKWAHEIAGLASPNDNQVVSRVQEATKRILGAGRHNRKEPLYTDVLKDIVESTDLSNILHLRNVCLCVSL